MTFEPFSPEHFALVDVQEAQRPFMVGTDQETINALPAAGPAWTLRDESGAVIGCSGMIPHRDGAWLAWGVFSSAIAGCGVAMTRFARAVFAGWPHPVGMYVAPSHDEAARFARVLGFRFSHVENGELFTGLHYYERA